MRKLSIKSTESDALIIAIQKGDNLEIKNHLGKLNLSKMEFIQRMMYLDRILQAAKPVDKDYSILSSILYTWLDRLDNGEVDGLIGDLCGMICISITSIVYVMNGCEDISPEEILMTNLESVKMEKAFSFPLTVNRLEQALEKYREEIFEVEIEKEHLKLQKDVWLRLLDIAISKGRKDAINFINHKIEAAASFAEIPKYITKKCNKIPEFNSDTEKIRREAQKIVLNMVEHKNSVIEDETIGKIGSLFKEITHVECASIVNSMGKDITLIDDPDMLEGPLNAIINFSNDDDNEERQFEIRECLGAPTTRQLKGCRMLTCICILEDEDDSEWEAERMQWFKGKCEECKIKIAKACYAMRLPLDKGGWIGCYCTSKCVIEAANRDIKQGIKGEEDFEHYSRFNEIDATIQFKKIVDQDDLYASEKEESNNNNNNKDNIE